MKKYFLLLILVQTWCFAQTSSTEIVFHQPATHFTESLPLGNGRIGAMVFGNPSKERIALNEISLWSGRSQDADLDAYPYLKLIQKHLLKKENKEAQELLMKHFVAKGKGSNLGQGANAKYGSYQTFGNLWIDFQDKNSKITDYKNQLQIGNALAVTTYKRNGVFYRQEVFTDYNQDILWVRISATETMPDFSISLERKENIFKNIAQNNELIMLGQLPSGEDKGMLYGAKAKVLKHNGFLKINGNAIIVKGAKECIIAIAMRTNYDNENGSLLTNYDLENALNKDLYEIKDYDISLKQSSETFSKLFHRSSLKLNSNQEKKGLTTVQRLQDFHDGKPDASLVELYYNYGKYLLISSSRKGLLPSNLQGIWAEEYQAPWNGDYHLNINLQMNYWLVHTNNLSDLAEPLYRFTKNLMPNGKKTAKSYYNAKGWVAHVISNPWFFTSPGEGAEWGSTLTGGAWLASHIWEHYLFTKDKYFLKEYYPVLKGSSEFLKDILIEEPENGWLVTAPSNSPENTYIMPNGFKGNTAMGPTMDMQIARNIFEATIEATKILNVDKDFASDLAQTTKRLAPNQISKTDGGVQEWLHDWASAEPQHRHVSHLYGLHPYDEITKNDTPELFDAARKTLEMRGDGGTGWSKAWKINFWARLQDGNHSFKMLKELLTPVDFGKHSNGGTYPNLFDAHPPFQIDGNFGATAGISEMLLQSHGKGFILKFLPAIPDNEMFKKGEVKGFRARNNFEVNFSWDNHQLLKAEIISLSGENLNVELPKNARLINQKGKIIAKAEENSKIVNTKTKKGEQYFIRF